MHGKVVKGSSKIQTCILKSSADLSIKIKIIINNEKNVLTEKHVRLR